jgi:TfoX/Sxy family transcriptional regulator of competence genes
VAYDEELANRVRTILSRDTFTEKRMFGGLAFLIGGHMGVAVSGQGGLMVRIPRQETDALLAQPGVAQVEMGKRGPMTGWLRASAEILDNEAVLTKWVRIGVDGASSLPPKR